MSYYVSVTSVSVSNPVATRMYNEEITFVTSTGEQSDSIRAEIEISRRVARQALAYLLALAPSPFYLAEQLHAGPVRYDLGTLEICDPVAGLKVTFRVCGWKADSKLNLPMHDALMGALYELSCYQRLMERAYAAQLLQEDFDVGVHGFNREALLTEHIDPDCQATVLEILLQNRRKSKAALTTSELSTTKAVADESFIFVTDFGEKDIEETLSSISRIAPTLSHT